MIAKSVWVAVAVLAIALMILIVAQARRTAEVTRIWQTLQPRSVSSECFSVEQVAHLPEPVRRYFLHAIAPGTRLATSVQLTLTGRIRLAANRDWLPLQADEILSTHGFIWKATAGQGLLHLQGADYYTQGQGRSRLTLWGVLPVVNAHNPDTVHAGMGRWIGEYFWLPSALLPQYGVSWQAVDENTIQADLNADRLPLTLTFVLDDRGRLLRASVLRWGNQTEDSHYTEIPFGGEPSAEQTFDGYTIPSELGAGWWIGSDRYAEFIRMTVKQAQFH